MPDKDSTFLQSTFRRGANAFFVRAIRPCFPKTRPSKFPPAAHLSPAPATAGPGGGAGAWNGAADGARPAQLMFPDITPVHWRVPTFHHDGAKLNAMTALREAMAELIIIREAIHQCGEAADLDRKSTRLNSSHRC